MPDIGIKGNAPINHHNAGLGGDPPAKPKLERQNGGRLDAPEGLSTRTSIGGGPAPRQSLLTRSQSARMEVPDSLNAEHPAKAKLTRSHSSGHLEARDNSNDGADLGAKPGLERSGSGHLEVPEGLIKADSDPKAELEPNTEGPAAAPEETNEADVDAGPEAAEHAPAGGKKLEADDDTKEAIDASRQQSANAAALALAASEAAGQQARLELMKSLAEMQAKSVKSLGDMLKGLA
jgi:hypothetical protein